jgi:hypothetical protein
MLIKIIMGLLLGTMSSLWYVQTDPLFGGLIVNSIVHTLEHTLESDISYKNFSLNLISPSIVLESVSIKPCNSVEDWKFETRFFRVNFSWIRFFLVGIFDLHISFDRSTMYSACRGTTFTLATAIERLMGESDLPLPIRMASLQFLHIKARSNIAPGVTVACQGHVYIKPFEQNTAIHIQCTHLETWAQGVKFIPKANGTARIMIPSNASRKYHYQVTGFTTLLSGKEQYPCTLHISGDSDALYATLNDIEAELTISQCTARFDTHATHLQAHFSLPVTFFSTMLGSSYLDNTGMLDATLQATVHEQSIQASADMTASQLRSGGITIPPISVRADCNYQNSSIATEATIKVDANTLLCAGNYNTTTGLWSCDLNLQEDIILTPELPIIINTSSQIQASGQGTTCTSGHMAVAGALSKGAPFQFSCNAVYDENNVSYINACVGQHSLQANFTCADSSWGMTGQCMYAPDSTYLSFASDNIQKSITCKGSVSEVSALLSPLLGTQITGDGTLILHCYPSDSYKKIRIECALEQGALRVPHTYVVITGLDGTALIDMVNKTIKLQDIACALHSGTLTIARAKIEFDASGACTYMHVPLSIKKCLISVDKDLWALCSGGFVFSGSPELYKISGRAIIDRSYIYDQGLSVISSYGQKSFSSGSGLAFPECELDIDVFTREPLKINTKRITATCSAQAHIANTLSAPTVSGSLRLLSGTVQLGYKPLTITKAHLSLQENTADPLIEFEAQSVIKNYAIRMYASGSLSKPNVQLSSTPALAHEQILSLLFAGAEGDSLNRILPALFAENLRAFVVDSDYNSYLSHALLKPLQYVHLVPKLIDNSGTRGFKGAVEVDMSDKWRAIIQKDLQAGTDPYLEVEYTASDDISIKAFRDERADVGAEVEFKFSF